MDLRIILRIPSSSAPLRLCGRTSVAGDAWERICPQRRSVTKTEGRGRASNRRGSNRPRYCNLRQFRSVSIPDFMSSIFLLGCFSEAPRHCASAGELRLLAMPVRGFARRDAFTGINGMKGIGEFLNALIKREFGRVMAPKLTKRAFPSTFRA